jgi:cytochrome b
MKTMSASPGSPASSGPTEHGAQALQRVKVWDAPTRVFHWLLVGSFAGAWLSAESERWALVHITLGYTMLGLVAFRLLWGVMGTKHARFRSFVRGPCAVRRFALAMLRGQPEHHVGHNPLGALAIVALLSLSILVSASGWAVYTERLQGGWGELHEWSAELMLMVVAIHVAGVALGSWMHRENLVGAMFSGMKAATPADSIGSVWRSVAVALMLAVTSFWFVQWQGSADQAGAGALKPQAQGASQLQGTEAQRDGDRAHKRARSTGRRDHYD